MPQGKFIAYYRVSTDRQGKSGLGLEAQKEAVLSYLNGGSWSLVAEFTEVESGKVNDRPRLAEALKQCRMIGATLVIAKLDRLARNASFLLSVVEGSGDNGVVFCDLPHVPAGPVGKFMVNQMAAVAELEAGLISVRTKAALAAAKARGVSLGGYRGGPVVDNRQGTAALMARADSFAADVGPIAAAMRDRGMSLRQIAAELMAQGMKTARGGDTWTADGVRSLLARIATAQAA